MMEIALIKVTFWGDVGLIGKRTGEREFVPDCTSLYWLPFMPFI